MYKHTTGEFHPDGGATTICESGATAPRSNAAARWGMVVVLMAIILVSPAQALTFSISYDASVANLTNAAQVETAFAAAAQTIQSLYTNASTVNLTVYWGNTGPFAGGIGLGASYTQYIGRYTYAELTNALSTSRRTAADDAAVASLPATDPIANNQWWCPQAEAKALGLPFVSPTDTNNDGAVGFASDVSYTFNPNQRSVANKFDFIGVAEHEITEVMGRIYGLNYNGGGYIPYDLFRFTNDAARSFNAYETNVYFSVDDGATALKYYYPDVASGDVQDWQSSSPADAFDASVPPGQELVLSSADLTAVDILGYDLNFTPPALTGTRLANGNFQISFTNTPGMDFVVLSSTNISQPVKTWSVLGAPTENSAGHYQYTTSPLVNAPERFYRVYLR